MFRSITALALLACLVCADAASAAERCKVPRGSDTIVKNSHAWVYRPPGNSARNPNLPEQPTYACYRRTGRRFVLDRPRDEIYVEFPGSYGRQAFTPVVSAAHLAYTVTDFEGADEEVRYLLVLDLATAKKRQLGIFSLGDRYLATFRLRRTGVVAWASGTDEGDERGEVWLYSTGTRTLLDSGPALDPESFAVTLDARRIYWMNGDQPKAAPFG